MSNRIYYPSIIASLLVIGLFLFFPHALQADVSEPKVLDVNYEPSHPRAAEAMLRLVKVTMFSSRGLSSSWKTSWPARVAH